MSKLARFKKAASAAKTYAKSEGGKQKLGSTGLIVAEIGTHAVLALASANYDSLGPIPVRPDIAGVLLSGVAMAVTKKGTRKLAAACLLGSAHAVITRFVGAKKFSVVTGPDGRTTLKEEMAGVAA